MAAISRPQQPNQQASRYSADMRRPPGLLQHCQLFLLLLLLAKLPAQAPTGTGPATWTSGDGSRFVFVPLPGSNQVCWTAATWCHPELEPPGLEGLAMAVAKASLGGTWSTGSLDPERERAAYAEQEQAWQALMQQPGDVARQQRVAAAEAAVASLSDVTAFARALAKLPAAAPTLVERDGICLLQLTTIPTALPELARLLVERRDEQALRELGKHWASEVARRSAALDADPTGRVRTELLALALPNHPTGRWLDRTNRPSPTRAQALTTWQASQQPSQTVHCLVGDFDPERLKSQLQRIFGSSSLTAVPVVAPTPIRPPASLRQASVRGVPRPTVAMAFFLPEIRDPWLLEIAARWLGNGRESAVGRLLPQAGIELRCQAPWPPCRHGQSLLILEASAAQLPPNAGQLLLQASQAATAKPPTAAELQTLLALRQRGFSSLASDPRRLGAELARKSLLWPSHPLLLAPPETLDPAAIQDLLRRILTSQPVMVEGRP